MKGLTKMIVFLITIMCASLFLPGCRKTNPASTQNDKESTSKKPKKYIAYSTDAEAYFMPRDFGQFQGEFTSQIMDVCREFSIPFTWLIVVDKAHTEVTTIASKVFSVRKDIDEFSLHAHFKWFIMDSSEDFESFKMVDRRVKWLKDAREEIVHAKLPMPLSFRYGGGDSNDTLYYIEDLIYLHDELGIRNYLFNPERIPGVIGINRFEQKENNVWIIDGAREITVLRTCIYLDEEIEKVNTAIDERLAIADYAIIGSHDYREAVPKHLKESIKYLNANHYIEYVTIDRIGEMVRRGEIMNE